MMKTILSNLAIDYPDISYYQGMNYMVCYIWYTLDDPEDTYSFMSYIVDTFLSEHFKDGLNGVLRLNFILDKILEIKSGLIWEKLGKQGVSSSLYSVSLLLTMFSCYISKESLYPVVDMIWDIFLAKGYLGAIEVIYYLLNF